MDKNNCISMLHFSKTNLEIFIIMYPNLNVWSGVFQVNIASSTCSIMTVYSGLQ